MGWSNTQAESLDGLAVAYTNTTEDYGSGSAITLHSGATLSATNSTWTFSGSSVVLDPTSSLEVDGPATFSNITLPGGFSGANVPRGIVARNLAQTDRPVAGTTATTFDTAATVITCTLASAKVGRIYLVTSPGLQVRMNVAARTGVQITFTEDGSTPTVPGAGTGVALGSQFVNCPTNGSPVPCNLGMTYVRSAPTDGPLKLNLSIWNVSGGGATVANANGGPNYEPIELLVIDMGHDPGLTP